MPSLKTASARRPAPPPTVVSRRAPPTHPNANQSPRNSPKSERAANEACRDVNSARLTTPVEQQSCFQIEVARPVAELVEDDSFADPCNAADVSEANGELRTVPLDIGLKSFSDYEQSQTFDAIDSLTEDELRRFRRRQRREALRMRDCLYQLAPEMPKTGGKEKNDNTIEERVPIGDVGHDEVSGDSTADIEADKNDECVDLIRTELVHNNTDNTGGGIAEGKVKRFRLWFDVSEFEPNNVQVEFVVSESVIEVSATKESDAQLLSYRRSVSVSNDNPIDRQSLCAVHTADGLLVVEGVASPEGVIYKLPRLRQHPSRYCNNNVTNTKQSLSSMVGHLTDLLRRRRSASSPSKNPKSLSGDVKTANDAFDGSNHNEGQVTMNTNTRENNSRDISLEALLQMESGAAPVKSKQPREKLGVATFHKDDDGIRRMKLTIDLGKMFRASDVLLQFIKDDKIQVMAKNQFKTTDGFSKAKFNREYELTEKIECHSLNGQFYPATGRLVIQALAKKTTESNDLPELMSNICRGCIGWSSADAAAVNGDGRNNNDGNCLDSAGANGYDPASN